MASLKVFGLSDTSLVARPIVPGELMAFARRVAHSGFNLTGVTLPQPLSSR